MSIFFLQKESIQISAATLTYYNQKDQIKMDILLLHPYFK